MKWLSAVVVLLVALPLVCCSTLYAKGKKEALKEGEKIDINTASAADLMKLPGIGEKKSEKIISNRPYSSVEDLKGKGIGIGEKTLEKLRPNLTCSGVKAEPEKKLESKEAAPAAEMPKEQPPKTE